MDNLLQVQEKINLDCDCLAIAGGWTPAVHLFTQSGGKLKFRDKDQVFIPNEYTHLIKLALAHVMGILN